MGHFELTTLLFVTILLSAKWLGFLFKRMGLPELVGELIAGVLLGNIGLLGFKFDFALQMSANEFLQYASELGVVLLLFQVGLESNMKDLLKVGLNSFNVAVVGVVLPVILGLFAASGLGLTEGLGSWFVGATLAATSVGITAKILGDAGLLKKPSSQVVLGAAVIDDVLGIVLLVVLAGIAVTGSVSVGDIGVILIKTTAFFAGAFIIGRYILSGTVRVFDLNTSSGIWTAFALILALAFAQVSAMAGLAPIIGSFMAGLVLEEIHFKSAPKMNIHSLQDLLKPITDMLLPIFFVGIGAQVKLEAFASLKSIAVIIALVVLAVVGKVAAGFVVRGKNFDRLGIGIGMVPRGEVGLIFSAYGLKHNIISSPSYAILVFVVLMTTVLGPILLKPRLKYF